MAEWARYVADDEKLGRRVAIKILSESIAEDIAERVRVKNGSGPQRTTKKKRVASEAQQLFLKGRFQWIQRHAEAVKQARSLNPNDPWAPHWLGVLMCGRGNTAKAWLTDNRQQQFSNLLHFP